MNPHRCMVGNTQGVDTERWVANEQQIRKKKRKEL
jgi:hypothetical protein